MKSIVTTLNGRQGRRTCGCAGRTDKASPPTHPVVSVRVVWAVRVAGLVPRSASRVAVYAASLALSHGAGRELVREFVLLRVLLAHVHVAFPVL